jgi:serine/threonine protein kinase
MSGLSAMARGGYATVYRATQESVGREVAIKVENRTLDDERDQARFLREARAAGRMSSHPHVVDLFDVGVTADRHPYLIMELCDGSYAERMRMAPLGPAEARDLGVKIADALAHSHAAGVLHRDVKPANILYSHFNPAVLADFGLAVLAEMRDSSVTLEVLTPAYAPPEMFRHAAPSPAVDVYALCATLYAVMRGKPPRWHDDGDPSLITLLELFSHPIPDLPGVPASLCEVLRYGMANDPGARPSAEQLRDLLADIPLQRAPGAPISGAPVSGTPTSGPPSPYIYGNSSYSPAPTRSPHIHPRPYAHSDPPTPPSDDATPTVRHPRRRTGLRRFFGGLGALLVLGGGVVGAWFAVEPTTRTSPDNAAVGSPTPRVPPTRGFSPTQGVAPSSAATPRLRGALPGCLVPLPDGARCPTRVECFRSTTGDDAPVAARKVPCAGRHTWEAFAMAELPAGVAADPAAVRAHPTVRRVCSPNTFRLATVRTDTTGWTFDVLPPDVRAGERTFRCLAGKGPDRLRGPTLAG